MNAIISRLRKGGKVIKRHGDLLKLRITQRYQQGHAARRAPARALNDVRQHLRAVPTLGHYQEILPPCQCDFLPPAGAATRWFEQHVGQCHEFPGEGVYVLRNARIAPGYVGAVIAADNTLFRPLSRDPFGWGWHRSCFRWKLPPCRRLVGRTLFIGAPAADTNYFHFLIDFMPRLMMARGALGSLERVDQIVFPPLTRPYQNELMNAVGLPLARCLSLDSSSHYVCDELVVPDDSASEFRPNPRRLALLRELPRSDASMGQRLFLSRKSARVRRLLNETEMETKLETLGYRSVTLEGVSVADQHAIFSSARSIVAIHGAAMANIAFCTAGTQVFEIADAECPRGFYWSLAQALGLRHHFIPAVPAKRDGECELHRLNFRDLRVDTAAAIALIRDLESQS